MAEAFYNEVQQYQSVGSVPSVCMFDEYHLIFVHDSHLMMNEVHRRANLMVYHEANLPHLQPVVR
jgi:hypothetical protein